MKSRGGVRTKEGPKGSSWEGLLSLRRVCQITRLAKVQERPKGTLVSRGMHRKITALSVVRACRDKQQLC